MMDARLRSESAAERRQWILSTLQTAGFLPTTDLARQLGVSQMTIRRDLHALEDASEVRMFHGGAGLAPSAARGAVFPDDEETEARRRVGAFAAGLIKPAETIVIDAGPTAYAVAQAIPDDFAGCVITHSMPVLQLLDERTTAARMVVLGRRAPRRPARLRRADYGGRGRRSAGTDVLPRARRHRRRWNVRTDGRRSQPPTQAAG